MNTDKGMSYSTPSAPLPGYGYGVDSPPRYGVQAPTYNQMANLPTQSQYMQASPHQPGATFRYRSREAFITCQHCGSNVTTQLNHKVGTFTWLSAGFVCLVGLAAGCCLIPFCLNVCKDAEHICPNCKKVVGVFKQVN